MYIYICKIKWSKLAESRVDNCLYKVISGPNLLCGSELLDQSTHETIAFYHLRQEQISFPFDASII